VTFKIAIIGGAYDSDDEEQWNMPLIGSPGKILDDILADAQIDRRECLVTSVFKARPPAGDLGAWCAGKKDAPVVLDWGVLVPGGYLLEEHRHQVDRLFAELDSARPNLAILLGNIATWAVLGEKAISKIRGTCRYSPMRPWLKCLPVYHPVAIRGEYSLRAVTVLDFAKAKREAEFPELRRPRREVWLEPTLDDIREFKASFLDNARRIAFDIETDRGEQITCISFAGSIDRAICIPFADPRKGGSYWPSIEEELLAWDLVKSILDLPAEKLGQNVLYDVQYLWMKYGIPVRNLAHDTMLLHHSLHPESEKGLGFLGSVYTNEPAWKADRPRGGDQIKREE
jgi:uracil-DNA glycosylase